MRTNKLCFVFLALLGLQLHSLPAAAEEKKPGTAPELKNKITAYLTQGATAGQAVITVTMSNVNPVGAISLPLKFASPDTFALDSLVTAPYRAGSFMMPPPNWNKDKKTLLINMLRSTDSVTAKTGLIPPGLGVLAVLYLSTPGKFPLEKFQMAAVQLPPENVLLYVTETFNSVQPEFELVRGNPPLGPGNGKDKPRTP